MIGLTVGVVIPQVQRIYVRLQEIKATETTLAEKRSYLQGLESLNEAEIARANTVLSVALPQEKPVLPLLFSVDRLATTAQVSLSNFQISPGLLGSSSATLDTANSSLSSISPGLASLPLQMDVAGAFENLSTFFKSLDGVVPFIQINSIQFASAQQGTTATTSAQYTAQVELSSLYLKSKPAVETTQTITQLSAQDISLIDQLAVADAQRQSDSQQQSALSTQASSSGTRTDLFGL